MIKKLQVLVREVYESEAMETKIRHNVTGQEITEWDFKHLDKEEQSNYTFGEYPNGKMKLEISEDDPIYGQVFSDLDTRELILHLNRTK